jgi:hypothetical protein
MATRFVLRLNSSSRLSSCSARGAAQPGFSSNSIAGIDEHGEVVERLSYNRRGQRRQPNGYDATPGSVNGVAMRGFTGKGELSVSGSAASSTSTAASTTRCSVA